MTRALPICLFALLFATAGLAAPVNLLPNPSFESGAARPDGWTASAPGAVSLGAGHGGGRGLTVTRQQGESSWAAVPSLPLTPGTVYHTTFWSRSSGTGGSIIAGLNTVNRDFSPTREWTHHGFFFRAPADGSAFYRLGLWNAAGSLLFDDASLAPALAVYAQYAGVPFPMGDGESLRAGHYVAAHALSGAGSNDNRFLQRFTASFNSNRWCFADKSEVVYHYDFEKARVEKPQVEISVNRAEQGTLLVEVSTDGATWRKLGETTKTGQVTYALPTPSTAWFLRLRTAGPADMQVEGYRFSCELPELAAHAPVVGATRYFSLAASDPELQVSVPEFHYHPGSENRIVAVARGRGLHGSLQFRLTVEQGGKTRSETEQSVSLEPGREAQVELKYATPVPGPQTLRLQARQDRHVLWEADSSLVVSPLYDARGGHLLAEDAALATWWCRPERKVSRGRAVPSARGDALRISLAGNEYEAAQLVLTPKRDLQACRVTAGPLHGPQGAVLPASAITIRQVAYVLTTHPTDELGAVDEWPDPLPLHVAPIDLRAGRNQPFWISVHAPAGTPAGDYRGHLTVQIAGAARAIPMLVHVWGFDLPRKTHVRTGFGLDESFIKRYHNLTNETDLRHVYDLYLHDFAAHRVAPYSFGRPIRVTWEKDAQGKPRPKFDFSGFDEDAHYALDVLGFNAFRLDLQGLGGGTFYARDSGEIAGAKAGTPDYDIAFTRYAQGIQRHLEEQGWLKKAYVYWFDEPDEKDNAFVRHGMEVLHRAAPKLTRLLTTHPQRSLYGAVDLWCQPTYTLDPAVAKQRQRAGQQVWWYLCTSPRAPYFGLFLDHYGTEIRLWLWETWKYGLNGILVWDTDYWSSRSAYPAPALQNPWQDPMSWVSGYGVGAGARLPWGNGDGRFLYPPTRDLAHDSTEHLTGPVPSIRWELLRDGIEDYEYFWLLRSEIDRLKAAGADPAVYREAEKLLVVPADVCASLTDFSTTPGPLHRHRRKLAEAIERLARARKLE